MAKVWFARRHRAEWLVPGGRPAYEIPLQDLIFKLDLGPQRWQGETGPHLEPGLAAEDPARLEKVLVETSTEDVEREEFSRFRVGLYDSPYSPVEVARRLSRN